MKTKVLIVAALALALCVVGFSPAVQAAEKKAPGPGIKAEVTGKAECKTEKIKDKEVKICSIAVASAKGEDGKPIAELAGKTLRAVGPKAGELEAQNGKDVVVKGVVSADYKRIVVESVAAAK